MRCWPTARAAAALGAMVLCLSLPVAARQAAADYRAGAPDVARTQKEFGGRRDEFRFVVVGDRTGGHRPGIFEHAMEQIEQLRPDFVITVGDLIEGNTEDRAQLDREWREVESAVDRLSIPFFYVPGNHDLTNEVQRDEWHRRRGADYYSFVYKDVLFLALNTEDPPQPAISRQHLYRQYGGEAMAAAIQALQGDGAAAEAQFSSDPRLAELAAKLRASENVAFSADQVQMVRKALSRHPRVRWTFVLLHRPAWKVDSPAFREIEGMLAGRSHTILAGHFHKYEYAQRGDVDYIQLGITGGVPGEATADPKSLDHVMWVAMDRNGPRITNLKLGGMFPKRGPQAQP